MILERQTGNMTVAQRCFIVFICGLSVVPGSLYAQDKPTTVPADTPATQGLREVDPANLEEKRQLTFTVGVMVLLGITITGLGLLLVVILWGHRVRRKSRAPLPEASRGDDLFYLKTGNKPQPDTTVIPPKQTPNDE